MNGERSYCPKIHWCFSQGVAFVSFGGHFFVSNMCHAPDSNMCHAPCMNYCRHCKNIPKSFVSSLTFSSLVLSCSVDGAVFVYNLYLVFIYELSQEEGKMNGVFTKGKGEGGGGVQHFWAFFPRGHTLIPPLCRVYLGGRPGWLLFPPPPPPRLNLQLKP